MGAGAVAWCAWWALDDVELAPIQLDTLVDPALDASPVVIAAPEVLAIDPQVFAVALWNPRPRPEAPPPAVEAPTEPIRLQLVAVVRDGTSLRAAVYDPEDDRIHLVTDGEMVRDFLVNQVTLAGVELSRNRSVHRLRIKEDPS